MRVGHIMTTRAALFVILLFFILAPSGQVEGQESTGKSQSASPPKIDVEAWALMDAESGRYLEGKNPDQRLPIASTTKIMVALLTLEDGNLDQEVTISQNAASYAGFTYSNIGLFAGDRVSVEELLRAALIPSATDADYALAEHLGDGSVKSFVGKMNEKADELGLKNTHFENPAGLDSPEHYSSARDLAKITEAAFEYPEFRKIVDTTDASISTQDRKIEFFNTNDLLNTYPPATGVKTGTTSQAGPCLVSSAESDGESYIAVILDAANEEERFASSRELLEYAFENYDHKVLVPEDKVYSKINVPYRGGESIKLAAARDVEALVGPGTQVERRVTTKDAPDSAKRGQKLGQVDVLVGGQSIGSAPLVAKRGYEEASLWDRTRYAAGNLFTRLRDSIRGLLK